MENKLKQSKYKTIVRFENGMEIKADLMNWVLYIPSPRTYWYYPTLDCVFTELLNLRIKELASGDARNNLESLSRAITQANEEIKKTIETVTTIKLPEQSRSVLQERQGNPKND